MKIYHEISRENLAQCVESLNVFFGAEAPDLAARIRADAFVKVSAISNGSREFSDLNFSMEPVLQSQPKSWCGWRIADIVSNLPYISEYSIICDASKELDFPHTIIQLD